MGWEPIREKVVVAATIHKCIWCGEWIEIGSQYNYQVGVWNGDFQTSHWHLECIDAAEDSDLEEYGFDAYEATRGHSIYG